MIRKTLMIGLFTCLGLVLTGVTLLAKHENRYHEILRLKKESERIPEAEHKAKVKQLALDLYQTYEKTEYLSLRADEVYYWCTKGSLGSRYLPMCIWPRAKVADFTMAMTPESFKTEITIKGKPLYTFLLKDGTLAEWKRPWNGVPGMKTQYPIDGKVTRLTHGVDGAVLCAAGLFRRPWIGPRPRWLGSHPRWTELWKKDVEEGLWIGTAEVEGDRCDSVLRQTEGRWDVYYLDSRKRLVMWVMVDYTEEPEIEIRVARFMDLKTDPIPSEVLSPSKELLKEAQGWQTLAECEDRAAEAE